MTKYKYLNFECGECPVWLGFEGPLEEMVKMCKQRKCYLMFQELLPSKPEDIKKAITTIAKRMREALAEEEQVECDGRCLNCDEFDPVRGCMVEE